MAVCAWALLAPTAAAQSADPDARPSHVKPPRIGPASRAVPLDPAFAHLLARQRAEEARRAEAERRRREAETRKAAEDRAQRDEAARRAATAQRRTDARAPLDADDKAAPGSDRMADRNPADASWLRGRDEFLRLATDHARRSAVNWVFSRQRDRISDDLLLQARATFAGGERVAVEIVFECDVDAGKRLKASARAFDAHSKAGLRFPTEEKRAGVLRGQAVIDDGAPQPAFLFPDRDGQHASVVEVPVTGDDTRSNLPRARAWLRHYQVTLRLRLPQGEAVANIHPYAPTLRRVLEACVP